MKIHLQFILITLVLFLGVQSAIAKTARINGYRTWASPDSTRLVIDLSNSVGHRLSHLSNPERVVIDIDHVQ